MYSVINVDISARKTDFLTQSVFYDSDFSHLKKIDYFQSPIIRGSSTVNGDSAHDTDPLAKEHNYVSFYVRGIRIRYDVYFDGQAGLIEGSCYVILFKLPYKDDEDIRNKLITSRISGMVLYSHPESVLCYDIFKLNTGNKGTSRFLNFNKPIIVRPNDYVGIFYYFPTINDSGNLYNVSSTAKVIFKPQ